MFGELCERCGCFLELHKRDLLTDPYTSATGAAAIRTLDAKDEGCLVLPPIFRCVFDFLDRACALRTRKVSDRHGWSSQNQSLSEPQRQVWTTYQGFMYLYIYIYIYMCIYVSVYILALA